MSIPDDTTGDLRIQQHDSDQIAQSPLGEAESNHSGGGKNNKSQQEQPAHSRAPTHRQRHAFAFDDILSIEIKKYDTNIFCLFDREMARVVFFKVEQW